MKLQAATRWMYQDFVQALHWPVLNRQKDPYHRILNTFSELAANVKSARILEIGARNVTGITNRQRFSNCQEYVGFDIHPGNGVDVTGDAHLLSNYFKLDYFDIVVAVSVFEHLMFPWKAVIEINKVMRLGGIALVSTRRGSLLRPIHSRVISQHWR